MARTNTTQDSSKVARLAALDELRLVVEEVELAVRLRKAKAELTELRAAIRAGGEGIDQQR